MPKKKSGSVPKEPTLSSIAGIYVDLFLANFEGLLVILGAQKRIKLERFHCQRNKVIISGKQSVAQLVIPRFPYH
jgi:hypothetical protein